MEDISNIRVFLIDDEETDLTYEWVICIFLTSYMTICIEM